MLRTENTVQITKELSDPKIKIKYYTLDGKKPEFDMCPGDLMLICNVLHDYSALLEEWLQYFEGGATQFLYKYHMNKCRKIQSKIEKELSYSTEKAIEKCNKRKKKSDDIGEDALVLATRRRKSKNTDTGSQIEIKSTVSNTKMQTHKHNSRSELTKEQKEFLREFCLDL